FRTQGKADRRQRVVSTALRPHPLTAPEPPGYVDLMSVDESASAPCIHCGVPVAQRIGGVPICDACYPIRGACCQEFGEAAHRSADEEPEDRGGSPPCDAHRFDLYADRSSRKGPG